jgi:Choline dehydrogenase and related flavoproteins
MCTKGRVSESVTPEECENRGNLLNCTKRRLLARPSLTIPESRGYLKRNSSNPLEYPLMYPHHLVSPRDVDILVDCIKLVIKLAYTPALQKYGLTIDTTPAKGFESYGFGSD